jgi:hypothetical protein
MLCVFNLLSNKESQNGQVAEKLITVLYTETCNLNPLLFQ